jgi:hypothetical protein
LSIPLSSRGVKDGLIWHYRKNGSYTCKSGYHVAIEVDGPNFGDNSDKKWRRLWNLKIPPKIKLFLWRSCQDCIPTRARLLQKGIEVNDVCVFYGSAGETQEHVFVHCSFVKCCWQKIGLTTQMIASITFQQWLLTNQFNLLDENLLLKVAVVV